MLVLTRKPGQSLVIGDEIEVRVLAVSGEKVRVGITAPREISIFREEIAELSLPRPSARQAPRT